jgi:hypothetical protein
MQLLILARNLSIQITSKIDAIKYVQDLNSGMVKLTRTTGEVSTRPTPLSFATLGVKIVIGPPSLTRPPSLRGSRGQSISLEASPLPQLAAVKKRDSIDRRSYLTASSEIYLSNTFELMGLSVPQRWVIQPADLILQKQIGEGIQVRYSLVRGKEPRLR